MSQTIVTFQTDTAIKNQLKRKAYKKNIGLSEYLRDLINQDLGIVKDTNPWLELSDNVQKIMSKDEITEMFSNIKTSRKPRSQKFWDNLTSTFNK